jgi:PAS domain S-box-containing protein
VAQGQGLDVEGPVAAAASMLPDRADLALIAVERTRMPMVVTDALRPERPIVLANQAFLNLTGFEADEVLGRNCRFMQGPDTSPDAVRRLREGLARQETVDVELLNYRKDGSTFWNAVHLSPVHDHTGRLTYYFGSQWDVSERHSAEGLRAAELRLLREVDHRAMNALALVQGFVRLSRRDTVERFAQSVDGRVQVLARTHTMLARTRWADVTLEHVLNDELGARGEGRAHFDGPTVLVSAERVQPLALLIHELASNAALHGALAQPDGRLEVTWRRGAGPGMVDMAWRELGAPVQAPAAAGFGLRLVSSIVRQQLQGQLNQTWGEDGLTTEVSCRIAAGAAA